MTAAPAPAPEPERVTETWIYAGRSYATKKMLHLWVTPEGRTVAFAKLPGLAIGSVYEVVCERDGEGRAIVVGDPLFLRGETDDRKAEWQARDAAHAALQARDRAERNAAKHDAVEEALKPLLGIASTLRTGAEKDAFAANVVRRLNAAW